MDSVSASRRCLALAQSRSTHPAMPFSQFFLLSDEICPFRTDHDTFAPCLMILYTSYSSGVYGCVNVLSTMIIIVLGFIVAAFAQNIPLSSAVLDTSAMDAAPTISEPDPSIQVSSIP